MGEPFPQDPEARRLMSNQRKATLQLLHGGPHGAPASPFVERHLSLLALLWTSENSFWGLGRVQLSTVALVSESFVIPYPVLRKHR